MICQVRPQSSLLVQVQQFSPLLSSFLKPLQLLLWEPENPFSYITIPSNMMVLAGHSVIWKAIGIPSLQDNSYTGSSTKKACNTHQIHRVRHLSHLEHSIWCEITPLLWCVVHTKQACFHTKCAFIPNRYALAPSIFTQIL